MIASRRFHGGFLPFTESTTAERVRNRWTASIFEFLAVIVLLLQNEARGASREAALKERFLAEAPQEWQKLEDRVRRWEGSFTESVVVYPSGKAVAAPAATKRKKEFFFNDRVDGAKIVITRIPDDGAKSVFCFNERYGFGLDRNGPEQQLYLAAFSPGADAPETGDLAQQLQRNATEHLLAAQYLWGAKLRHLVDGTTGTMTSATLTEVSGHPGLRLNFERKLSDAGETPFACWATVDPDFHWAVTAYEQRTTWGFIRLSVTYQPDIADVAFPQRIVQELVDSSGRVTQTTTLDFAKPQHCDLPASQFTLEAFGLEPPGSPREAAEWRISKFVLLNSTLLIALGTWFLYLYRRHKRRPVAQ